MSVGRAAAGKVGQRKLAALVVLAAVLAPGVPYAAAGVAAAGLGSSAQVLIAAVDEPAVQRGAAKVAGAAGAAGTASDSRHEVAAPVVAAAGPSLTSWISRTAAPLRPAGDRQPLTDLARAPPAIAAATSSRGSIL